MPDYIFRANIDQYLELLDDPDLAPEKHTIIVKLLVEEEDRLSHYQEQLEFAETRAANGRTRLDRLRSMRDGDQKVDREKLDRLILSFELIQRLLDNFCHQLRGKVTNSPL